MFVWYLGVFWYLKKLGRRYLNAKKHTAPEVCELGFYILTKKQMKQKQQNAWKQCTYIPARS